MQPLHDVPAQVPSATLEPGLGRSRLIPVARLLPCELCLLPAKYDWVLVC